MAQGDMSDHSGVISVTVPSGGYTKGKIYLLASASLVVALETKAAAAACPVLTSKNMKVVEVAKVAGTGKTIAAGAKVYFVSATNNVTGVASGNTLCGVCEEAATATATTVKIRFGETI
jgi:predicted RecA/RadA family phage recombinase